MKNTLERLTIKGVLKKLSQHFQVTIDTDLESDYRQLVSGLITSNDRYTVIEKIRKQQNAEKSFQYPFLGLVIENISLDFNAGKNAYSNFITGQHVLTSDTNYLNKIIRTVPVVIECSTVFITDDFWQMLAFASKWVIGSNERSTLSFEIGFHSIRISVIIEFNTNLAIPQKDNTLDTLNIYEIIGALSIKCYMTDPVDFEELLTSANLQQINISMKQKLGEKIEGVEIFDLSDIEIN